MSLAEAEHGAAGASAVRVLDPWPPQPAREALAALEQGAVLFMPKLAFEVRPEERPLLDPAVLDGKSKNLSYDGAAGKVGGSRLDPAREALAAGLLSRFSDWAESLVLALAPGYREALQRGRTSLRPCEVENRALSPRKDDRRLHVDSFASRPVQGRRILRVFANVDPDGAARTWRIGEPFEAYAGRFLPRARRPSGLSNAAHQLLGLTKGRRTGYDALMLALHDLGKADDSYQTTGPEERFDFPSGSSWIVFTDSTVHAAIAGKCALEQTFYLPVEAMDDPGRSPLRILERKVGRPLV